MGHENNPGENSFSVKHNLALNNHWFDALLDYSPTILRISVNEVKDRKNEFIESLRQQDFHDLKFFQIDGKPCAFNVIRFMCDHMLTNQKYAVEILSCMNLGNFNLKSLVLRNLGEINDQDVEDFFLKHCGTIERLELENCWDKNIHSGIYCEEDFRIWEQQCRQYNWVMEPSFAELISRTGSSKSFADKILDYESQPITYGLKVISTPGLLLF